MDFTLTEEQKMLVQSAEQFAKKDSPVERFRKLRADERGWEPAMWQKMGELGWLGIPFPEEVGGFGGSLEDAALVVEQLGRALVPEPYIASVILAGRTISDIGTDAQKEKYLAPLIEGKVSLALAYSEEDNRYELNEVHTSARASGDGYVLSGKKVWVLNGHAADFIIVSARTSGGATDKDGITLFVVDVKAPGVSRMTVPGHDGQKYGHVVLKDVKIGKDAVLGQSGKGLAALEHAVDRGAAMSVAEGLGHVRECLARTVDYMKVRVQFGVPIGSFQALQHRAADMFTEVQLLQSMTILASLKADDANEVERKKGVSAAKVALAQGGWYVTKQAIQLHGGIGCTDEQDVGLFFKRMHALNHLFGDEAWHLKRYSSLEGFEEKGTK